MARIILITGGCRSGKSAYAQKLGESLPGRRAYLATCPVIDEEMGRRIERHKQERKAGQWQTIEETLDLGGALEGAGDCDVVLVDCLTLWVNNLMYRAEQKRLNFEESDMVQCCTKVIESARRRSGTVIFVTNEVGLGIVPENAASRRYRDLVGRCNQCIAAAADTVTLVTCGIPLHLKGL